MKWDLRFPFPPQTTRPTTNAPFVIPTGAYPDFLLRRRRQGRVCGFP